MRKYIASTPRAEVNGQTILSLIQNIRSDEIQSVVKKHGFERINPTAWYPAQNLFDIYRELADQHQDSQENFMAIGVKGAETAILPPEVNSLEAFFQVIDAAYRMNFRNIPPEEGYKVEFVGPGHVHVTNNTPTPDVVAYGVLWGFCRLLTPRGRQFSVRAFDSGGSYLLNNNFEDSDEATTFEVTWS